MLLKSGESTDSQLTHCCKNEGFDHDNSWKCKVKPQLETLFAACSQYDFEDLLDVVEFIHVSSTSKCCKLSMRLEKG